jgi:8-amino-7-oxononanoate synthase
MPETTLRPIHKRMTRELSCLREQLQLRTLDIPGGLDLCSNDYLGLATDTRFKHAVIDAVSRVLAVGSSGSRLLSGNSREWVNLESMFADFAGTEAALYFGSGYAANVGLLSSVLQPGDLVFSDALNHASLIDGVRLSRAEKVIYPHCDLVFLETALREHANAGALPIIVTESVFSMEGDTAPINSLLDLARTYDAELVIDEAHATGVCGPQGRGISAELGVEDDMLAIVHTCGKALASAGAFVCGGSILKEYLVNRARTFIFSTAMPPYLAGQIQAALSLAREADGERAHLRTIASALREGLASAGLDCGASSTHIVPVMFGNEEMALHVASELRHEGFAVKAIRPPTVPPGTARIRISVTSRITMEDVRHFVAATTAACKSLPRRTHAGAVHA